MLFRFLIILALVYAGFFLLRWWRQGKKRGVSSHAQQKRSKEGKLKRKGRLIRDPKTGEYRPQRDDDE